MKENLIQEISNAMTDVLSIEQMAQLNGVLLQVISKYTITKDGEKEHENAATHHNETTISISVYLASALLLRLSNIIVQQSNNFSRLCLKK